MTQRRANFIKKTNVSRETMEKLDFFSRALTRWNGSINLIAKSTLPALWTRHFLDSAQLWNLAGPVAGHWVDIGTGGGFPGLVLAILAAERAPDLQFTLVESDLRKTVFLQTVARELSLQVTVKPERIETLQPLGADVLSARALAPLGTLVGYAERHLAPGGAALFMKGAAFRHEYDEALEKWSFQAEEYPSITDGAAVILKLGDITRV
jgi:16S rRNA (guanine527-N7)-methyltransferase